jgi:superfamily I DNA/RNA helicase
VAFTIPERLPEKDGAATQGERKVFAALRQYLPEDYLVYYDVRVGDRYPDFVVIGPDLGLVAADDRLQILTFHAWCARELRLAKVSMPPAPERGQAWHEYWEQVPSLLLDAYASGRARGATYQAILVDEGQDFANDWYRVILKALDPASNSLFIALDSSQNIYKRKSSWRDLGVEIVGHSRVLRINYRNTRPILNAAYGIISELDSGARGERSAADDYVTPDRALRDGPPPELRRHASLAAAREFAREWIQTRLHNGVEPGDILVLGLARPKMERLTAWLTDAGVPASFLLIEQLPDTVRLSTIHSAKGLDAACVLLFAGHDLDTRGDEEARRLLYIAMTRARDELCVSSYGNAPLIEELREKIG